MPVGPDYIFAENANDLIEPSTSDLDTGFDCGDVELREKHGFLFNSLTTKTRSATENYPGIVEESTQAETDAGVIDGKFVAPAKLATSVQAAVWNYTIASGTANALTAALIPAITAPTAGMRVRLKIAATNTLAAPTLDAGGGSKPMFWSDGTRVEPGDLVAGEIRDFTYDGIGWQLSGISPAQAIAANTELGLLHEVLSPGAFNWTAPRDGTFVFGMHGAGGGGGYGATNGYGSGGGSGAYAEGSFSLLKDQAVSGIIGAGGVGGTSTTAASNGGLSRLTIDGVNYDVAGGPQGLNSTDGAASASGSSAKPTWGRIRLRGQSGTLGRFTGAPRGGDGGSAPFGGPGGPGGFIAAAGVAPGGGGGGCGGQGAPNIGAPGGLSIYGRGA